MILGDSTSIEKVSLKSAELWLDTCKFKNQRKLRQYWVDYLANEMQRGTFVPSATNIQLCFCVEDGNTYLVNGQHTLKAVVKSGIPLDGTVITRTIANEMIDVDKLYIAIDVQNKRTTRDAFRALGAEEKWGIGQEPSSRLSTAAIWIESGITHKYSIGPKERRYLSDFDKYFLAEKWLKEYKEFDKAITPCEWDIRVKLHYGGVLSIALLTFRFKPIDAIAFWKQVAQDDGLKIGDPRKTLRKWLMSHAVSNTAKSKTLEIIHPEAFPRAVAKCWTKWMEGEELRSIRTDFSEKVENMLFGIPKDEIVKLFGTLDNNTNGTGGTT